MYVLVWWLVNRAGWGGGYILSLSHRIWPES